MANSVSESDTKGACLRWFQSGSSGSVLGPSVGPPKLPAALQNEIAAATIEALKLPDVQAKLRTLSVEPLPMTPAETAAFIKDEARRWGDVIRQTGVAVE